MPLPLAGTGELRNDAASRGEPHDDVLEETSTGTAVEQPPAEALPEGAWFCSGQQTQRLNDDRGLRFEDSL